MIRAVVFDFDGVIANSEPLHYRAFREVLRENGADLSERDYYTRYLGYDDIGAFKAIAADQSLGWDAARVSALVAKKAIRMEELEQGESVLFPGIKEAIERLAAHVPLAIASGAIRAEIERVLHYERLAPHFRTVVAAEDTPLSKPAPDPYQLAVRELSRNVGTSLMPGDCVAIEDSLWGLESARTAGLRTIGITHTYDAKALEMADLVIDGPDRLTWELLASALK